MLLLRERLVLLLLVLLLLLLLLLLLAVLVFVTIHRLHLCHRRLLRRVAPLRVATRHRVRPDDGRREEVRNN